MGYAGPMLPRFTIFQIAIRFSVFAFRMSLSQNRFTLLRDMLR
jgi:hypothetical protein